MIQMQYNDSSIISTLENLNENGDLSYAGYSKLLEMVAPMASQEAAMEAAKADIAALLWLNGNCEYCKHGVKDTYSGASRWRCSLGNGVDCRPEWRGVSLPAVEVKKVEPKKPSAPPVVTLKPKPVQVPKKDDPQEADADLIADPGKKVVGSKGFLLIECPKCNTMHGFCSKKPLADYACACGHKFSIRDLALMHMTCKCGKYFRYRTNITRDMFTYTCLECGAPVDLEWNKKAKRYDTVK